MRTRPAPRLPDSGRARRGANKPVTGAAKTPEERSAIVQQIRDLLGARPFYGEEGRNRDGQPG